MARKILDSDLETDQAERSEVGDAPQAERRAPPVPRRRAPLAKGGAAAPKYIESSTRSVTERSHEDIPVDQIQDSIIDDRIDVLEGLDELVDSIDKNGQQIPIIVRIVNKEKPYEIVAGRRRLAAIRRLGRPKIRGFITRMSDKEAFIAQGIENSARLETSFIERARTVVKAYEAGFEQSDVAEFLSVSQTLISFMVRIYEALGEKLVVTIGPARGIGRRKWEKLVTLAREHEMAPRDLVKMVDTSVEDSAERFEKLMAAVERGKQRLEAPTRPAPTHQTAFLDGRCSMTRKPRQLLIKADKSISENLLDFISERMPELIEEYREKGEKPE